MVEKTKRKRMLDQVRRDFPHLYTKSGKFRKLQPRRFKCDNCGDEFNKTKKHNVGGLGFGIPICGVCGARGKEQIEYLIWNRWQYGVIEVEEFILDTVEEHAPIHYDELYRRIREKFEGTGQVTERSVGFLVYYGYLNLDPALKEKGINAYIINPDKNLVKRYNKQI